MGRGDMRKWGGDWEERVDELVECIGLVRVDLAWRFLPLLLLLLLFFFLSFFLLGWVVWRGEWVF